MTTPQESWKVYKDADLLFDEDAVLSAIQQMANDITAELKDRNPLVLCVMNGGLFVTSEITKRLNFPLQMDYMQATRYRGNISGAEQVVWLARPQQDLTDRAVLILDDILDEGHTLVEITRECEKMGAASIHVAVLLKKIHDRCNKKAQADFIGLEVEDRYVFGCGMDYKEYLRNLPGIYAVKE
jgi:hypoxanthine phosphoribosyltransferase